MGFVCYYFVFPGFLFTGHVTLTGLPMPCPLGATLVSDHVKNIIILDVFEKFGNALSARRNHNFIRTRHSAMLYAKYPLHAK